MQPWENIKNQKVLSGMAWKHRPVTSKTRMFTFLHDIAKTLAKISKMHQQSCLTDKDHPEATSCKPIYHGKPVICKKNFRSQSAKKHGDYKQNSWYGKLWRSVVQGADEVGRESFVSVDFLISPEQYANKCMAVLIRRVTCKCLFSFWGQRKVFSSEIHLEDFEIVSLTAERLTVSEVRPSQQPF